MAEEQIIAQSEEPAKQSFIKSQKGQLVILAVLIAVVAGVWGAVFLRSGAEKPTDIKVVEASTGTSTAGIDSAAGGAPTGSQDATTGAPATGEADATQAAALTADADVLPPDVSTEEAERLERLLDRVYENRDPFEGEKSK